MNNDDEASTLSKATNIIRRDILQNDRNLFKGNFSKQCQQDFIPTSLNTLISIITNGASITDQSNMKIEQPILSISQLIMANTHSISHEAQQQKRQK